MPFIRLATRDELPLLAPLERAAAALFRESPYPELADGPLAADSIRNDDFVWVIIENESLAGFAIVRKTGDALHIQEIDVHPSFARRGFGRLLIERICKWSAELEFRTLTLTTFSNVAWNGPYYSRLGFVAVANDSLTPELKNIFAEEAKAGIPMEYRIAMKMSVKRESVKA